VKTEKHVNFAEQNINEIVTANVDNFEITQDSLFGNDQINSGSYT
jgi:hypothetical protein